MRYRFWGLILGRAYYTWRGLFSEFYGILFINEIYGGMETGHFDSVVLIRTQAVKSCKKFDHFKKSLHLNKKNILGEYFSFFKSSM